MARAQQPPIVENTVPVTEDAEDEDDVAIEGEEQIEEGYASSTPTSSLTWITWFCSLPGHEYFCEVTEDFIEDDFNLTGLNNMVPFWKEAMEMVLDVEPEDTLKIPDVSIVEASAELLYGLVHQRYILTRAGLQAMVEKYEASNFGTCPRVYCLGTPVVPCGRSDLPGLETVKLYCPNCNDLYTPPSSRFQGVDGAFFGTTFPHLFFQTYRELAPAPYWLPPSSSAFSPGRSPSSTPGAGTSQPFVNPNPYGGQKQAHGRVYTPKIYGFRVSEHARSGPRMQWLRMRPETANELDMVDWRGRWKIGNEDEYEDEGDHAPGGPMEDFDPERGDDDDEEESEEEEEDHQPAPTPMNESRGSRRRALQPFPESRASASGDSESDMVPLVEDDPLERASEASSLTLVLRDRRLRAMYKSRGTRQRAAPSVHEDSADVTADSDSDVETPAVDDTWQRLPESGSAPQNQKVVWQSAWQSGQKSERTWTIDNPTSQAIALATSH